MWLNMSWTLIELVYTRMKTYLNHNHCKLNQHLQLRYIHIPMWLNMSWNLIELVYTRMKDLFEPVYI